MKQKIFKLVLTGGPSGGKSSILEAVKRELRYSNLKVIALNETSTELVLAGYFWKQESINLEAFHQAVFKLQYQKELIHQDLIKTLPNEKILVICDRGLMDSKVYMKDDSFNNLLKSQFLTERQIVDSYDMVVHLETSLEVHSKEYSFPSEEAKQASIYQAKELDKKIQAAWSKNKKHYIVKAQDSYEKKEQKALELIMGELKIADLLP